MKTAKKRALAFLTAVLVVMTTVFGHVDYNAKAEEMSKTIAAWEYTAAPENLTSIAATTGSGTLTVTGGPSVTGYSSSSLCATPWAVNAGWVIDVDASSYTDLKFTAKLRSSKTGPANMNLKYSVDNGSSWSDIENSDIKITSTSLAEYYKDFSLPTALNDSHFLLKVNMADNVSVNGGTVASGGTSNINGIIISGTIAGGGSADTPVTPPGTGDEGDTEEGKIVTPFKTGDKYVIPESVKLSYFFTGTA